MNPELHDFYQELVNTTGDELPDGWTWFLCAATYDRTLLQISLSYLDANDEVIEFTPVPSPVFAVVRKIRAAMEPKHAWTRMDFDFFFQGKYHVKYKYDDAKPAAG